METNNETPKRRLEDVTPAETIDWSAPGAPAVPLSPAADVPTLSDQHLDWLGDQFVIEADADSDAELRAGGPRRLIAFDYFKRGYLLGRARHAEAQSIAHPIGHLSPTSVESPIDATPAATSGTDEFMVYGRAGNRRVDLEAKLRDALAASMPGPAATSGDAPADGWPSEIYLNAGDDPLGHFDEYADVSWCDHPQGENDVRYVRAELARIERTTAHVQPVNTSSERVENASGNEQVERAASPATASGDELPADLAYLVEYVPHTAARRALASKISESIRAAVSAATKPTADLSAQLEEIAQSWDGCRYDAPGEMMDIGASLRSAFAKLSLLATKPAAAPAVPEGWKLIPVEPTAFMIGAGARAQLNADTDTQANSFKIAKVAYAAMLAAAPASTSAVQDQAGGAR